MNTDLEFWAEYFRANPDHQMSQTKGTDGVSVRRYDQAAARGVGPVLALFTDNMAAYQVITKGRELAIVAPQLSQAEFSL